jgi:hypothetical protein
MYYIMKAHYFSAGLPFQYSKVYMIVYYHKVDAGRASHSSKFTTYRNNYCIIIYVLARNDRSLNILTNFAVFYMDNAPASLFDGKDCKGRKLHTICLYLNTIHQFTQFYPPLISLAA